MGEEQIRYSIPCQYLHEKVEKRLGEYWSNMRKVRMLKKELDLLNKRQDNLKAIDTGRPTENRRHERKSSIDSFVADKEDAKALIKAEIKRMEDENDRIDFMIRIIGEPYNKLLSLRYLDQAEWVEVAMEIGYSVDYTQKELRKKSLDLAAECLFPLIGLVDYD